jgi:hypothetical protein
MASTWTAAWTRPIARAASPPHRTQIRLGFTGHIWKAKTKEREPRIAEQADWFATTHWSVVRTAGDPSPMVAQEALAVQQRTRRIMIADMPYSPREDRLDEPTRRP